MILNTNYLNIQMLLMFKNCLFKLVNLGYTWGDPKEHPVDPLLHLGDPQVSLWDPRLHSGDSQVHLGSLG